MVAGFGELGRDVEVGWGRVDEAEEADEVDEVDEVHEVGRSRKALISN